jgi:hypothetical protein
MNTAVVSPSGTHILEWLGISLTPGLGPTKSRKLVEHFGSAEAVFHASLTEAVHLFLNFVWGPLRRRRIFPSANGF